MKNILFLIPLLIIQPAFAQTKLPVIKATSKKVSINDGGYFDKDAWNLSPGVRPDIYTADHTRETKWVTFYTDIDSIRVKIKAGTRFNFVILLNGKDSCYTQIASAIPPENQLSNATVTNDTIPFTLTKYNAIGVKAIINDTDTLNLHFDTGSFDFRLTRDAIVKKTKLLSAQANAIANGKEPDYNHLDKVDKLQIGSLTWTRPGIMATGVTAHDMDGRFGWNLFDGKSVEINYDRDLLIIHSKLPKNLEGYKKSKLEFKRGFVCMKGTFKVAHKKYTGDFIMDTGADRAMVLDSTWAASQAFVENLQLVGLSVVTDTRGNKYVTKIVDVPHFKIGDFQLDSIPVRILGTRNPAHFGINTLGNDLLKRFNVIFDFATDEIYLKPNKLVIEAYKDNS